MSLYDCLKERWLEDGVPINDEASQKAIEHFEHKYKVTFPSSFKEYLMTVDGMPEGQTDENLISFLPLKAIDQECLLEHKISANEVDLIFAEFSIYSHYYVLRIKRNSEEVGVLAANGEIEKRIANSFEEFIDKYIENPYKVAYCWT